MMDHQQAVKSHAAERYLLEELSPEERDDFEEHYFSCGECGDEVRSAFALSENVKTFLAAEARTNAAHVPAIPMPTATPASRPWWGWLRPSIAVPVAAALLLGITLYQSLLVIPRLERNLAGVNRAQVIPTAIARAATRGEDPIVQVSGDDPFVQLILDVDTDTSRSSFTSEVYDEAGALKFSLPATEASGGSLHLLLPAAGLKPGRYVIRVRPGDNEYSFQLRSK